MDSPPDFERPGFPPPAARKSPRWLRIVAFTLLVKLIVLGYGGVFLMAERGQRIGGRDWVEIWNRWDAPHYLDIARDGYVHEGVQSRWIVFFPLYPLLVRLTSALVPNLFAAALLTSAIASVATALLLFAITRFEIGDRSAWESVLFLLIFPTSHFLHIGYTESTFLALSMGSILCARRQAWAGAGLLGALACLTRINGLVLVPALLVEATLQYRRHPDRALRRFFWLAAIPGGFSIYLLLNELVLGDPFAFLWIQRVFWYKFLSPPWVGIIGAFRTAVGSGPEDAVMVGWAELGFTLLALGMTVWSAFRLRPTYAVWMAGNWLLLTSTNFLLSAPRYTLVLFPMFILFGETLVKRPAVGRAIAVACVLLLALFIGRFVQGEWAF